MGDRTNPGLLRRKLAAGSVILEFSRPWWTKKKKQGHFLCDLTRCYKENYLRGRGMNTSCHPHIVNSSTHCQPSVTSNCMSSILQFLMSRGVPATTKGMSCCRHFFCHQRGNIVAGLNGHLHKGLQKLVTNYDSKYGLMQEASASHISNTHPTHPTEQTIKRHHTPTIRTAQSILWDSTARPAPP